MQFQQITPSEYFAPSLSFSRHHLPDLATCGPVSASLLAELQSPLHFLLAPEKEETRDMQWGSLVDLLWLTPRAFKKEVVVLPEDAPRKPTTAQRNAKKNSESSRRSIDWWDHWERKSQGKTVITKELHDQAKIAVSMLNSHHVARHILEVSQTQVVLTGSGPFPIAVPYSAKAMIDLLPMEGHYREAVVDLKQCHDLSESGMARAMHDYQYHLKMAWYMACLEAAGRPTQTAILIFQCSKPPYDVKVRQIAFEELERGREAIRKRLEILKNMKIGEYKQYFDVDVRIIKRPNWLIE